VADETLARLIARLDEAGVVVAAWDITSDVGVPAYTCTIVDDPAGPAWRGVAAFSGHGAHLSAQVALVRALSEAIQSRATVISGSRDDMFPRDYLDAANRDDHVAMTASFREPPPSRPMPALSLACETFEDDLALLLGRVRAAGASSAVVVDLTREDVGIPVVKVVVPGLEAFRTSLYTPGARARAFLASIAK
jgi:ribosomal protein S12 methylthiotransferase accessory factor